MRHLRIQNLLPALLLGATALGKPAMNAPQRPSDGWPPEAQTITVRSTCDGTEQPCMFYAPDSTSPAPLLISLHTWGGTYRQRQDQRFRWCVEQGWVFLHPHFRGPNRTPAAMGSDLAVQDILDAVAEAQRLTAVDSDRVYLLGFSGGGHMALLLAGRHPERWAGVSAWCGISDVAAWHAQRPDASYAQQIESALGGNPQTDPAAAAEAAKRSPLTWLERATALPIDIATGIHDGHTGSVPVSQSLEAFNRLAAPADRLTAEEVEQIVRDRAIPASLRPAKDLGHLGKAQIHFRRQSAQARITLFEGGHTGFNDVALRWLSLQRRGTASAWTDDAASTTPAADMRGQ